MEIRYMEIFALLILALISDIKTYKIKNVVIFPFILIGLLTNGWLMGLRGFRFSVYGMLTPVALLLVLFALRMLGAGDIKLFSAIGAVCGTEFVMYSMAYSFLSGGVMALLLLLVRKNGRERLRHLAWYLKSCCMMLSLLPYTDFEDKSDGAKFHFALAIACGTVIQMIYLYMYEIL